MNREQQAEYLKAQLAELLNDKKGINVIKVCHVEPEIFTEMAFCFIAKHGK